MFDVNCSRFYVRMQRPRDVVVHAQNEKGEPVVLNLGGSDSEQAWVSRIFQHEYDHLQVSSTCDCMRYFCLYTYKASFMFLIMKLGCCLSALQLAG
jgi:hypothetical protein